MNGQIQPSPQGTGLLGPEDPEDVGLVDLGTSGELTAGETSSGMSGSAHDSIDPVTGRSSMHLSAPSSQPEGLRLLVLSDADLREEGAVVVEEEFLHDFAVVPLGGGGVQHVKGLAGRLNRSAVE
jgi:hypothetical protein